MISVMTPVSQYPVRIHHHHPSRPWRTVFLDTLLFILESWKMACNSKVIHDCDPRCRTHTSSIQSGIMNIPKVWLWWQGVLAQLYLFRELKIGIQVNSHKSWQSIMIRMVPSKCIQLGTIRVLIIVIHRNMIRVWPKFEGPPMWPNVTSPPQEQEGGPHRGQTFYFDKYFQKT